MTQPFVLDCSATLPWIFADASDRASERLLDALADGTTFWVPALWHLELGNVLLGARRRRRIDAAGIELFLGQLQAFDIRVDPETLSRAWSKTLDLAWEHQLSSYDATYLELAMRRGLALATRDDALIRAARTAGVKLL